MISEPDYELLRQYKRDRATQAWSFGVAIPVALAFWSLIFWHLLHLTGIGKTQPIEQISQVTVSSVQVRKQDVAVPKERRAVTAPVAQRSVTPQKTIVEPRPQAQPTEIARVTPQGTPVPKRSARGRSPSTSLAQELARQQAQFSQEAQQLNASRSAVSVATADPNLYASQQTPFKSDVAGSLAIQGRGNGYIYPLRMWISGGLHCYEARYEWIYPTGGEERGTFPWPICFSPSNDLLAQHRREIPIPYTYPQAGYQLPSDAQLTPIERMVYDQWRGIDDQ